MLGFYQMFFCCTDRGHERVLRRPHPHQTGASATYLLCVIVMIGLDQRRICVHTGDCRAVLCHQGEAVQLSRDHTADDQQERDRIKAAGGRLHQVAGSWRIGAAGIQVSR